MPTKCSVFVGVSLDGFIARIDGAIDWLDKANAMAPVGEDFGFSQFMSTVDAIVMGRNTFELVLSFEPWPYGSTPVVVLSNRLTMLPPKTPSTVSLSSLAPRALVEELSAKGMSHLYVDGGLTIQSFLATGMIDELTLTRIPVLLGSGVPLFGGLLADVWLEHLSTEVFEPGFVQSRYRIAAAPQIL